MKKEQELMNFLADDCPRGGWIIHDQLRKGARIQEYRRSFMSVLSRAPHEVDAVREALVGGRVDGSVYEGMCCCLVGTIANAQGVNYESIPGLVPDVDRPAESFFRGIGPGDTPENNPFSALAVQWVDEWLAKNAAKAGA